jgi:ankyrin repeat protein
LQDDDGWTALMHASYKMYYEIVELLLAKGANQNLKSNDKYTAGYTAYDLTSNNSIRFLLTKYKKRK